MLLINIKKSNQHFDLKTSGADLKTIAEIIDANEDQFLSGLKRLVGIAELEKLLNDQENLTVFAPDDEAFKKVPQKDLEELSKDKDEVNKLLLRHVVPRVYTSTNIQEGTNSLQTAGKDRITVTKDAEGVKICYATVNSKVIKADINASNGVIHIIDTVLLGNL